MSSECNHPQCRGRKRCLATVTLQHLGGWVAPLSPDQFAGSPQADTGTGGDLGGTGEGGDGGSL